MSRSRAALQLGPFVLERPIGRGGMGEVWRGRHASQDVPVAIKVLTARRARRSGVRVAFRNEVRAVARLNHRGVVHVFDHGLVPESAEQESGGRLLADSPYLAMELAERGSLKRLSPADWPQLRAMLLAILDALAHAHARGVIHRDLKPANVLIAATDDGARLKLSDFGIAHAIVGESDTRNTGRFEPRVSGTPHYMAPEQVLGEWRRQGPWTDLYSLGCLAFELASGRPPFWDASGEELQRSHVRKAPPLLESHLVLPEGFRPWVERLLAKQPQHRFRLAADAAWALLNLPGEEVADAPTLTRLTPPGGLRLDLAALRARAGQGAVIGDEIDAFDDTVAEGEILTGDDVSSLGADSESFDGAPSFEADDFETPTQQITMVTLADLATQRSDPSILAALAQVTASEAGDDGTLPFVEVGPPPLPPSWRRADPPRRSMPLIGAGLGLYGMRSIPMVDREPERDNVWQALHTVRREGKAQAMVLTGAAGNGKSRLVEWMTQRAHEVGAALTLRATHSPIAGPADGLPHMVAQHLRCVGQARAYVEEQAARFVAEHPIPGAGDHDGLALAELIAPSTDRPFSATLDQEPTRGGPSQLVRVRLNSPEERYAVVRRMLERMARERPVIVWLEDVQWGSDALAFARSLLETQLYKPLPVLLLITARDEALSDRGVEAGQLRELRELEGVRSISVEPLNDEHQEQLIKGLLGLESHLASRVVARTAGNPLFAVQLVGDWVQRGVLTVGSHGFHLEPGERAPLPDDIHQLWATSIVRVAHAVAPSNPEPCWLALEVAAALGIEVIDEEWRLACELAGVTVPDGLVDGVLTNRLVRSTPLGWSFVHGMVRESLERSAREAHRWPAHHRACAEMLQRRYGADQDAVAERLGRHLVAAERHEQALAPLLRGAQTRYVATDLRAAHGLLDLYFETLGHLGLSERDARWGDGWIQAARIRIDEGRLDEAQALTERAEAAAKEYRWGRVLARAGTVRGYIGLYRGDLNTSLTEFQRAVALFKRVDDPSGLADCCVGLGKAYMWRRDLEPAAAAAQQAQELYRDSGDSFELGRTLKSLGNIYQSADDMERAAGFLQRARSVFEQLGNRRDVAGCLNDLGEIHRLRGDLADAEGYYRRALALLADERISMTSTFRINLALVLLARDEYDEARGILEELARGLEPGESGLDLIWVDAGLLPALAAEADWEAWDATLERLLAAVAESELVDEDIPWCAQLAGDLAVGHAEFERARAAYSLAVDHWRATGRQDEAADALQRLEALDTTRRVR